MSSFIKVKTQHGDVELDPNKYYHCVTLHNGEIVFTKNNCSFLMLVPSENILAIRLEPFNSLKELTMFVLGLYEHNPQET